MSDDCSVCACERLVERLYHPDTRDVNGTGLRQASQPLWNAIGRRLLILDEFGGNWMEFVPG